MSGVVFLGIAAVLSAIGTIVLWARNRKPDTPDASIEEFRSHGHFRDLVGQAAAREHPPELLGGSRCGFLSVELTDDLPGEGRRNSAAEPSPGCLPITP